MEESPCESCGADSYLDCLHCYNYDNFIPREDLSPCEEVSNE